MSQLSCYVQIKGLKGSSTDDKHPGDQGWFAIESFDTGVMQTTNSLAAGKGQQSMSQANAQFSDVSWTKMVDGTTPQVQGSCAAAKNLPEVLIHFMAQSNNANEPYLIYTLTDAMFSSVSISGGSGGGLMEHVSVNFAKIKVDYNMRDEKGAKKGATGYNWDLVKNTGSPGM